MVYRRYVQRDSDLRTAVGSAALVGASLLAVWFTNGTGVAAAPSGTPWSSYLAPTLFVAAVFAVLMRLLSIHRLPIAKGIPWFRIFLAVSFAEISLILFGIFYREQPYSTALLLVLLPLGVLSVGLAFVAYRAAHEQIVDRSAATLRVLIVGTGSAAGRISDTLAAMPGYYRLVGHLNTASGRNEAGLPLLGDDSALEAVVRDRNVDEVIIADPTASQKATMDLIGRCMRSGVRWKVVPATFEMFAGRTDVDVFNGIPVLGVREPRLVGVDRFVKRAFDALFAAVVLIVLSPVLVAIALGVKLTSRGPALFRQTRVGLNGQEFTLHKFRSMYVDSGESTHQSFSNDWVFGRSGDGDTAVHKLDRDPRVTPIGRFIRKTSLDELPQFWDVLRGKMSVVGPRPPLPYEVANYTEFHRRRLKVPPGITGLWQVSGRNSLSFEEMVQLDVQYIETWTLGRDLKIVALTIPSLLTEPGS